MATPPPPKRFVDLVGGVLLVLGQQQLGTALGDAWLLTEGLVTRAGLVDVGIFCLWMICFFCDVTGLHLIGDVIGCNTFSVLVM
jgi:hypothetical protein